MDEQDRSVDERFRPPDEVWAIMKPMLPPAKPKKKDGRPRMDDRQAADAIYYVLRTGCQWKALPRSMGAASTVHDRFTEWVEAGVFAKLMQMGLIEYDEKKRHRVGMAKHGRGDDESAVGGRSDGSESD